LLLALFLGSLNPYWLQAEKDIALYRYLAARLNLAIEVDGLNDDPNWQIYKASHEQAESMRLTQLMQATVGVWDTYPSTARREHAARIIKKTTQAGPPIPPAATNLRIVAPIQGIHRVARFVVELDDENLLSTTREVSANWSNSVFRWGRKRHSLVVRNWATIPPGVEIRTQSEEKQSPQQQDREDFIPALGKEVLLATLTLSDVRELAKYELPAIPDTPEYGGGGPREIQTALGMLPRNLRMASLFAQLLLLFVITYFGAFVREAVTSAVFPVPGTLFSAFAKSRYPIGLPSGALESVLSIRECRFHLTRLAPDTA
jgi:hypothetical protein